MKSEATQTLFEIEQERTPTKKETILSLYNQGTTEVETIAAMTGAKPSYIASVLQREGLIDNYFDLYTTTAQPMNIYSERFKGKLGFRNVFTAYRSVRHLEEAYREFERNQDRAGQHHTLEMGLTMLNRARWTGKIEEAEVYRRWLVGKFNRPLVNTENKALSKPQTDVKEAAEKVQLKLAA